MSEKFTTIKKEGYTLYINENGPTLGIGPEGKILVQDGYAFKDLNRNGKLDPYEDWRLPIEQRIVDLAERMSVDEIAGLMLYSDSQLVVKESTRETVWDLTAEQKKFFKEENLRHILVGPTEDTPTAARWSNNAQALVEALGHGIPLNSSSDPRHTPAATAEFDMGAGGDLSVWPVELGLAATFDPDLVRRFGEVASREYRAMGITTALSPQVDLASDPRWFRFYGTFGEGSKLTIAMARAYCDGFQTSMGDREFPASAQAPGWGYDSVNAMTKHWPGGGSGEGGRDAHFAFGKYAVYPGKAMAEHLKPFLEGAFKLEGKTGCASAVMPYYTISWDYDPKNHENVGNSYNKYIITGLLREKYGYDGVVCTDWLITADPGPIDLLIGGKCWGVETLSVAERRYKALVAGVDQFGGVSDKGPVVEAYKIGVKEHGEEFMQRRFRLSARRLLRNIFRVGLFENPYLDVEESGRIAGCPEFVSAGYEAQLKSIVMLKNEGGVLPLKGRPKVYIPKRHINRRVNFLGISMPEQDLDPLDLKLVSEYFEVVDRPEAADCALCCIESPKGLGYQKDEGYVPISLQYRPYTAATARKHSIAGSEERSYRGKTGTVSNEPDLDLVLNTKKAMGNKPIIVLVNAVNPFVAAEFEKAAAAILLDFAVQPRALLDILSGRAEPSALLPFQMPKDMETVETQFEDVCRDMIPYTDSAGNTWDFAYGLNWKGVIDDDRVRRYR
jgi:beta-glucosidase